MAVTTPESTRRRITLILDASGSGRALLEILPLLCSDAAKFELDAVLIESEAQRRAAELPFVREFDRLTISERTFGPAELERAMALRKQQLTSAVRAVVKRAGIEPSVKTMRAAAGLREELAATSDITMFEPLRHVAHELYTPLRRSHRARSRIVVAIDDWVTGTEALLVATLLARRDARRLSVLLRGRAAATRERVAEFSRSLAIPPASFHLLPESAPAALIEAARREAATALVLGATEEWLGGMSLKALREQLRCPVCLVRRSLVVAESAPRSD